MICTTRVVNERNNAELQFIDFLPLKNVSFLFLGKVTKITGLFWGDSAPVSGRSSLK